MLTRPSSYSSISSPSLFVVKLVVAEHRVHHQLALNGPVNTRSTHFTIFAFPRPGRLSARFAACCSML